MPLMARLPSKVIGTNNLRLRLMERPAVLTPVHKTMMSNPIVNLLITRKIRVPPHSTDLMIKVRMMSLVRRTKTESYRMKTMMTRAMEPMLPRMRGR